MKKNILFYMLFISVFIPSFSFAHSKDWVNYMKQSYREITEESTEEELYHDIPWWFGQAYTHAYEGESVCDEEGYFFYDSFSENVVPPLIIEAYQQFTRPEINLKCFMRSIMFKKNLDTSDECILQRRKHKEGSSICWFDYKRFLPKGSKINSEQEFLYLTEAGHHLINEKYCEKTPELTTKERENCKEKVKVFLKQLILGKAPHCRDTIPEEYRKFLLEGRYVKEDVKATLSYKVPALQKFGSENFCSVQGWEDDVGGKNKKSSSSGKGKSKWWPLAW